MCFPALAAIPAVIGAASTAAGAVAGTGTFLGLAASTWGAIGAASSLIGTGVSAIGQMQQGKQQAAVAKTNAELSQQRALDAQRRGSVAEGQQRTQYQRFIGAQRAAMGASGVVSDVGSSGDVLAETAGMGERDAQQLRVNAEREAWGFANEANMYGYQAKTARQSGIYKAGATFLGGANDILREAPWWKKQWGNGESVAPGSLGFGSSRGVWG